MAGYLGYDRCALGMLLGALEEVRWERQATLGPARALSSPVAIRSSEEARVAHRRAVDAVSIFAEPIGAILRGDPLGRYRTVTLDSADLSSWALHRGGTWATVTDPTEVAAGWLKDLALRNARLVAASLDPRGLRELLDGDVATTAPLVAYLGSLRRDPAAAAAFLSALGPQSFAALVEALSDVFTSRQLPDGPADSVAERADQVLMALGSLWAVNRTAGRYADPAWDAATLGGPLFGAARLLSVAAGTPGALSTAELAGWGTATWQRLVAAIGQPDLPPPELIGDLVLEAVSTDGRAARSLLLRLAPRDLVALLANGASSPSASGHLLLASTDPSVTVTAADEDEVRRSVQAVARVIDHLLSTGRASFPVVGPDGRAGQPAFGRELPTGVGRYLGGQLDHLIDPCEDAHSDACPVPSRAWPGWRDREAAGLLSQMVTDRHVAVELHEVAWAGALDRLAQVNLIDPEGVEQVETEAFVLGALGGLLRGAGIDDALADQERFDGTVAAIDMAIDATSSAVVGLGPIAVVSGLWGPASDLAAATGWPSPGELVLRPFRPTSIRQALARSVADEALEDAVLKSAVGALAFTQLEVRGQLADTPPAPFVPIEPHAQVRALIDATRPGGDANAVGQAYQADLLVWRDAAAGTAAGRTIDRLMAATGDAAAQGTRWAA